MSWHLVSFDGYDFAAAGYTIKTPWDFWRGQLGNTVPTANRPGHLPVLSKGSVNPRRITFEVIMPAGVDVWLAYETFLSKLQLLAPIPRRLVMERPNDAGTATQVECMAIIETPQGVPSDEGADTIIVTWVRADPVWRIVTPAAATTVNPTMTDAPTWSAAVAYTAVGSAPIAPVVTINPGAPASGTAPNRYRFTRVNGEDHPIEQMVWMEPLGDTSGWTGSTAANTYLFCDGIEVPRQLVALGETRSYLQFVIDFMAEGQTKTYDIMTGGTVAAIATAPKELIGTDGTPIPDFGWQVITTTAAGTGTTTVTASALATGTPYVSAPTNRWAGGYIVALTGAAAGTDHQITANTSTTLTIDSAFAAYASGSKFLIMSSWYYAAGNSLFLNYAVRLEVHSDYPHGLWAESDYDNRPQNIRYDYPASWQPIRSVPNDDDVSFYSTSPAVGDYFTTPNMSRTWQGGDDNSNRKERGGGDGVTISFPVPITNWKADYQFKNPNGVGKAVFASRQTTAETWTLYVEDTTTHATLTDIAVQSLTFPVETHHLLFALWPRLGDEIPLSWARDSGGRSGGGYTTMDDDTKDWPVTDMWAGARWRVTSGKGQGKSRTVTASDPNTLTWSTPLESDDVVPNDGSRYEVVNPPLMASLRSNDFWQVVLNVSKITGSGLSSLGAAERVALRIRANGGSGGTTPYVRLDVGADERLLWVSAGDTVEVNCDAQTAYVMNGATVVKDVTDWVIPRELEATGGTVMEDDDWFPIIPGSGDFYVQRTGGVATASTAVSMPAGWFG